MKPVLLGLVVMVAGGLAALVCGRWPRTATRLGVGSVWLGSILALVPAGRSLWNHSMETWQRPWTIPGGALSLQLDSLSAFFLFPILILSSLAALYGSSYLKSYEGRKNLGVHWFFYTVLVASMVTVVLAHNAVLFLMAWEVMSLSSFFLVTFEHEQEPVREAGWIYLVATHLGTACLFTFFLVLGQKNGSLEFDRWSPSSGPMVSGGWIFLLALVGFGTKAGLAPLHVWLPEAHPAAPSHVSALMSGVMIKTGIYGLLRAQELTGALPGWVGWLVLGVGLASGMVGILFALSQHDLKRLLAYSSVENIGIIAIGIGMGLLGLSYRVPALAILGFAASLAHVINHACFKSLLFLGAGAVAHATGTRNMNRLGGLLKRMPITGAAFAIGAAAICGLPPFNGFMGEFLLLVGAYRGGATLNGGAAILSLAVIAGMAFIGGLAVAGFTKAFGTVFLGEPRTEAAAHGHEVAGPMRWPMVALAGLCVALGLAGPWLVPSLFPVVAGLTGLGREVFDRELNPLLAVLPRITGASLMFMVFLTLIFSLRRWLLLGRLVEQNTTWGCGYLRPSARIQYTASSYSQPFAQLFSWLLRTRRKVVTPEGFFPREASFESETPDICHGNLYHPAFLRLNWGLSKLRWLQSGKVHRYVMYIGVMLLVLLVWKLAL